MADKFDELMKELRLLKKEMELKRLREVEDRTIFIKIHFEFYPISCEILAQMFSGVVVESIDRFRDGDQFHSRIRFPNRDLAVEAFKWFNGRCIYLGCCQLDLFLESTLRAHSSLNGANTDVLGTSTTNFGFLEQSNSNFGVQEQSNCNLAHLGEGVVEEIAAPNLQLAKDSVRVPKSFDATENDVPNPDNLTTLHSKIQESSLNLQECYKSMEENNRIVIDITEQMRGTLREMADELRQWREEIEAKAAIEDESSIEELGQETDSSLQVAEDSDEQEVPNEHSKLPNCSLLSERRNHEQIENQNPQVFQDSREREMGLESSKVKFESLDSVWGDELGEHCLASVNGVNSNVWGDSAEVEVSIETEMVEFWNAYNLFDEMPNGGITRKGRGSWKFDPGGLDSRGLGSENADHLIRMGKVVRFSVESSCGATNADRVLAVNLVFDPGIAEIRVEDSIDSTEMGMADFGWNAYKLFDEMPNGGIIMMGRCASILCPYDRGKGICYCSGKVSTGLVVSSLSLEAATKRLKWDPGGGCLFWGNMCHHFLVLVSIDRRQCLLKTPTTDVHHTPEVWQKMVESSHSAKNLESLVLVQNGLNNASGVEMEKGNGLIFVYDPGIFKWVFGRLVAISMLKSNFFFWKLRDSGVGSAAQQFSLHISVLVVCVG